MVLIFSNFGRFDLNTKAAQMIHLAPGILSFVVTTEEKKYLNGSSNFPSYTNEKPFPTLYLYHAQSIKVY